MSRHSLEERKRMHEELLHAQDAARAGDAGAMLTRAATDTARILQDAPGLLHAGAHRGMEVRAADGTPFQFRYRQLPRAINAHIDADGQWDADRMFHWMIGMEILTPPGVALTKLCHGCGPLKFGVLHCGRCGDAHYCSAACQRADWPRHRAECVQAVDK